MKLKFKTPAKINLGLHIHGKREDGFHELETIFQMVCLYDDVELELLPSGINIECDTPGVPIDHTNLAFKAALLLQKSCHVQGKGVSIRLKKKIPFGAGLGGGSGNAAGVLMGLNRLWDLNIQREKLMILAAELGSDVPFFLQGGTALGENHGELITQLPDLPPLELLLIVPNQTIPNKTSTLYSQLMSSNFSDGGVTNKMVSSLLAGQLPIDAIFNVFESIAFQTFPALSDIFQVIEENIVSRPHLCDSGPAIFCLPSNRTEFDQLSSCLRNTDFVVYFTNCIESKAVQCQSINPKNNRS